MPGSKIRPSAVAAASEPSPVLDVLVLGSVEVRSAEAPHQLDRPLERALLTRLALARGRPVSDERLIADLWAEPELARPVHRLRVLVSRMRGTLGKTAPVVRRVAAGYALAAEPTDLVAAKAAANRLHVAKRAADPAAVRAAARDALERWRGPALADLRTIPYAANEAERLDAWRLDLLVERLEADLALGAAAEVTDELAQLVTENPLHERLCCLLALALYRTGKQAEALDGLAKLRRTLVDELGVDAAPETAAMEIALLRQDSALQAPAATSPVTIRSPSGPPDPSANPPARLFEPPKPAGDFIGREEDVAELSRRLARPGLVTLVGEPGSGKSRLAMEAARGMAVAERKVVVVELAPLRGDGAVVAAVAAAAGIEGARADLLPACAAALEGTLLVLDNAEHVVAQVADLCARLDRQAPEASVLVTSQRPLRLRAEHARRVGPLDRDAAVRLLERRCARDALPAAREDLDAICAAVDRLPLGIELAGGLTRTMSVAQVAARLGDRLRLLVGGTRDSGGRHTSLQAALDRSHDLLGARERAVLRRVSVFAGDFGLEAAEHVAVGPDIELGDLAPALAELVDRSLVTVEAAGGVRRFRLLETVRAYARAELAATGEMPAVRAGQSSWRRARIRALGGTGDLDSADQTVAVFQGWPDTLDALEHA
ncbi:AfsR/SARP family transcriptional regulator [Actinomadura rubrisoli]|uniref:AfsR/SARP family transcriptional regulator n=1 Tax=Actinomadura rubrisoli TaxID=2530368 RepID=A0A4V2YX10_9ACTN|nr:BTAD domain-containing putative transcriptional regulator [Actinomadura rubrisoli]TDD87117.1 AfsR/SARP family transcriptional regulator [Actinomadura rubrisoli]